MKICTMLFVGLLLEASLFASGFESEKKCIQNTGVEGNKVAETIMLYSTDGLLQERGQSILTAREQYLEEALASVCLHDYMTTIASLATSPDFKKKQEEFQKFRKENEVQLEVARAAAAVALQQKSDLIKTNRQRLKDDKVHRLLDKQNGYKEFTLTRTRYAALPFKK